MFRIVIPRVGYDASRVQRILRQITRVTAITHRAQPPCFGVERILRGESEKGGLRYRHYITKCGEEPSYVDVNLQNGGTKREKL